MRIKYLGHSGFLVETEKHLLMFDYCMGEIPALPQEKTLLIFVSHHHPDHISGDIFQWKTAHPRVQYILSDDIHQTLPNHYGIDDAVFAAPENVYSLENCTVRTLRSTDCGTAFLVQCDGKTVFHAGDLCLWLWPGMDKSQSFGMMQRFIQYTSVLREYRIDLAFLTLDNRQEPGAFCNIDYYMRHFAIEHCVPMHYFGTTEIADRLVQDPSSDPYREKICKMEEGETAEL